MRVRPIYFQAMKLFHGSPKSNLKRLELGHVGGHGLQAQGEGLYLTTAEDQSNYFAKGQGSVYEVDLDEAAAKVFRADDLNFVCGFFRSALDLPGVKTECGLFSAGASSFYKVLDFIEDKDLCQDLTMRFEKEFNVVRISSLAYRGDFIYVVRDPALLRITAEEVV